MKITLISDTHCYEPEVGSGDLLVHAGDFLSSGHSNESPRVGEWLGRQAKNFKNVVCIAGNHDWDFSFKGPQETQEFFNQFADNIHYLCHESIEIDGIRIFGSPYTPEFNHWAFNVPRDRIGMLWSDIPQNTDLLVTHGPPYGILDQAAPHLSSERLGCRGLAQVVQEIEPKWSVHGHIHGGRGRAVVGNTEYFNASMVNEAYQPVHEPYVVEI